MLDPRVGVQMQIDFCHVLFHKMIENKLMSSRLFKKLLGWGIEGLRDLIIFVNATVEFKPARMTW